MRYSLLLVLAILLAACSGRPDQGVPETLGAINPTVKTETDATQTAAPISEPEVEAGPHPDLPNLGPAPELTNEVWLNTDQPLPLAELKGNVVLLEMWTFG
jgi:hypothetical protein